MCSIFGMFDLQPGDDLASLRRQALELSQRQRHRGPDWSGVFVDAGVILVHERLAIVDPASGAQPLRSRDGALALAVNGEIYNHRELRAASDCDFTTGSDCEVINALYRDLGGDTFVREGVSKLNGIFAFAIYCDYIHQAAPVRISRNNLCYSKPQPDSRFHPAVEVRHQASVSLGPGHQGLRFRAGLPLPSFPPA